MNDKIGMLTDEIATLREDRDYHERQVRVLLNQVATLRAEVERLREAAAYAEKALRAGADLGDTILDWSTGATNVGVANRLRAALAADGGRG